jgi:glutathione synthase/RimK-type ligase-like ATP-grasp enzyme
MTLDASDRQLAALDRAIARDPDNSALLYGRASLLAGLGRDEEARRDYLAAIAVDPTHFGALNDLGTLLYRTDFRTAARTAYAEAVRHHPDNPMGRINLGNALLAEGLIDEAQAQFQTALSLAPDHPDAHQGLANLLQQTGDWSAAERHRLASYVGRAITHLPYRGKGKPCRVLLLVSAAGGNVPTRFLLDETLFETWVLAVETFAPEHALPLHDVVFNAVGDADMGFSAFEAAERVLACTLAPVVNPPLRVRRTGRAANAALLAGLPGVIAPKIASVAREDMATTAAAFGYPLLLRSPGYHTGQYFKKVDAEADLATAAAALPGAELLMIQHLDARDEHGLARKYRAMMVGGQLFPLHLALSRDWKVHYFTADMAKSPEHRAREAAFLEDMPSAIGPRAMSALRHIRRALDLDYGGIDFALARDGSLLLFEANATMVVAPPGPEPMWDYRRAAVRRILQSAQAMVLKRAGLRPFDQATFI